MKCPRCGRHGNGRFCSDCGTPLSEAACRACGAGLETGARFCTQCGAPAAASSASARPRSNAPWYLAGGVLLVMIAAILVPMLLDGDDASDSAVAPFASTGSGTPPPLSGNMRENADRLFNRIMEARETGDPAQAAQFYPMAIQAYQAAEPLDADGLYHLSLIQTAAGNPAAARATAERILDMAPNHLLGLGAAGEASMASGEADAAREFYERFLEHYETERTQEYPEYLDHARILPAYEQQARSIVGS